MNYLNSKFSVYAPGTKEYADNWDRIFKKPQWTGLVDADVNKSLEDSILAQARQIYREQRVVVFYPATFANLTDESGALDALNALVARDLFVRRCDLYCADGHPIFCGDSVPSDSMQCPVCSVHVDPEDDLTFDLKIRYLLKV